MSKLMRGLLWVAVILAAIAGVGRLLLFEPWTLPDDPVLGASVAPTLRAGDTVLMLTRGTPHFGELVRCADPENPGSFVVGRVAGLPRDEVSVEGATLRVNGTRYDSADACKETIFTVPHPDSGNEIEVQCQRVQMGGDWHYRGSSGRYNPGNDHTKEVGQGRIFVLSDNRDYHDDSRDFGTVPIESCDRRIVFRLWGGGGWGDDASRLTMIH